MGGPVMVLGEPPDEDEVKRMQAHALRIHQAEQALEIEQRQNVIKWRAIVCSCRQVFGWPGSAMQPAQPPPQAGCVVHGGFMVRGDTGEVL